ncbi:MAG: SDR family oxidoreductase [Bacteroidales bacterium]|nr:SDR family oxidoreductase [Bacteroidales bacterium]
MNIDLTGKTILVTGASRGIGRGIAEALGKSGATVAVHYRKNNELAETLAKEIGNDSRAFQADLEKPEDCNRLFEAVIATFGRLDVLVNNAGIFLNSPLESDRWLADWNTTLDVNLRATALLSRLAILHFQQRGGGRIINISSRAAFRGDNPEHLAYAASKAGMVALTRSIARGYGKNGITAFLIAPGWVKTDMNKETIERLGEATITRGLALNKLTEPKDLAPMIVLLASGLADHATGTTIDINAGSYVH